MNREVDIKLLNKVPMDVIMNHILPYTYLPQPLNLMEDVRSFSADYSILENAYAFDFNYNVLFYDLLCFFNKSKNPEQLSNDRFIVLMSRMFKMKNLSNNEITDFIFIAFHRDVSVNITRKIRFLWGILTPIERTRFINKYIIEY